MSDTTELRPCYRSRSLVYLASRAGFSPANLRQLRQPRSQQQCLRIGLSSHEPAVQLARVLAVSPGEDIGTELLANPPAENSVVAEAGEGIGIQYLRPLVGIIPRAVAYRAAEKVGERRDHGVFLGERRGTELL